MANDLVVIEDSTILSMLADSKYTTAIPCLYNKLEVFRAGNTTCGECARKRQARQRNEMAKIKTCLAALSNEKKAELKQLLGATKLRVTYVNHSGQVVALTF
jgi:hypothetical protein